MMTSNDKESHKTDIHSTSVLTGFVQIRFWRTTREGQNRHSQVEMMMIV